MGCLAWFFIIFGIIGLIPPLTIGGCFSIAIGLALLALGKSTAKTQEATEKTAALAQVRKDKDLWVANRMNTLINNGLSISDAKIKAEMDFELEGQRERWVIDKTNEYIYLGIPILKARARAEMEYNAQKGTSA